MKTIKQLSKLKSLYFSCLAFFAFFNFSYSQQDYLTKSQASLVTLNNQTVSATNILDKEETVVVFIESFNDDHAQYIQEIINEKENGSLPNDIKIVAICYDNLGTYKHIKPFINKRNWDIEVYIDKDRTLFYYVNLEQPLLTLVFNNKVLVKQFFGKKDDINASFFGDRYDSILLN